jgi:uncharacterized protein
MKTALAALALLMTLPLAAVEREEKEVLIAEILELLDLKKLAAAQFERAETGSEEERALRDRVLARIDYAKMGEELYAPIFRDAFTAAELKELVAFYRTKVGQKSLAVLPHLAETMVAHGPSSLWERAHEVQAEIEREKMKERPDLATMRDLRTIAVCLETRATDTDEYPTVAFEQLPPLLEPVYVRVLPREDAWGTPFAYVSDGRNYRVISAGADKKFEWDSRKLDLQQTDTRFTDSAEADLIFQNGTFLQAPRKASSESGLATQ